MIEGNDAWELQAACMGLERAATKGRWQDVPQYWRVICSLMVEYAPHEMLAALPGILQSGIDARMNAVSSVGLDGSPLQFIPRN